MRVRKHSAGLIGGADCEIYMACADEGQSRGFEEGAGVFGQADEEDGGRRMKIKGFDKNMQCRGMQYEIGKIYDTGAKDDEIRLCSDTVYHYCDTMQKVHGHYDCASDNRYCEIEVLGAEVTDGDKCGSNRIKILREIMGDELKALKGLVNGNTGLFNSGNSNSGYRNSGDRNSGNGNSGHWNSGYWNSGDYNSGYRNSGYRNSGCWNSGNSNSGSRNSGHWNSGDDNSGDRNTGNSNSGIFNTCDFSCGVFCTESPKINIFNVKSEWTMHEFMETKYYDAIYSAPFILTEWVYYTDDEKRNDPQKNATGGYLKQYKFHDACKKWWKKLSPDARKTIMEIPNFDPDIFFEITGIEV